MFLALWELDVKPGSDERFISTYGPDGDWAQCFGATLLTNELSSRVIPSVTALT
jgi:hypothetical protein